MGGWVTDAAWNPFSSCKISLLAACPTSQRRGAEMKRSANLFSLLTACVIIWLVGTAAQPETKLPVIGLLVWSSCEEDDILAGLADWGRIPGRNIEIVCKSAGSQYDGLTQAAKNLADLKVDVIVTSSQPAGRAAHQVTQTIPIVTIISGDPVSGGLAKSSRKTWRERDRCHLLRNGADRKATRNLEGGNALTQRGRRPFQSGPFISSVRGRYKTRSRNPASSTDIRLCPRSLRVC